MGEGGGVLCVCMCCSVQSSWVRVEGSCTCACVVVCVTNVSVNQATFADGKEYLPRVPFCYEHVARSILQTPVFCVFELLSVTTMCYFGRGGAKKPTIGSS